MKHGGGTAAVLAGGALVVKHLPALALVLVLVLGGLAATGAVAAGSARTASTALSPSGSLRTDGSVHGAQGADLNATGFLPTYYLGNTAGMRTQLEEQQNTLGTAIQVNFASPIWVQVNVTCQAPATYTVGKIVLQLIDLNVVVSTFPLDTVSATNPYGGVPCSSAVQNYTFADTDFTGWQYVISGTWGGNVLIYDNAGNILGEVDFMMKVNPPIPVTVLTLPLILLVVYEVYSIFHQYRHMPRKPKVPTEQAPPPATPAGSAPPPASTPPPGSSTTAPPATPPPGGR